MIGRLLTRARRRLTDETGTTLIDALVGTIVTGATLCLIGTAIFGYTMASQSLSAANKNTSTSASADTLWRADAQLAFSVTSTSPSNVTFTYPGQSVPCTQSTWAITTTGTISSVTDTTVSFDGIDTSVSPAVCVGDQIGKRSAVIIPDAAATPSFTFTNIGGRPLTLNAAGATLGPGTQPAQVSNAHWDSVDVGKAVLQAQLGGLTLRSSQLTPQVTRTTVADKPSLQLGGQ